MFTPPAPRALGGSPPRRSSESPRGSGGPLPGLLTGSYAVWGSVTPGGGEPAGLCSSLQPITRYGNKPKLSNPNSLFHKWRCDTHSPWQELMCNR